MSTQGLGSKEAELNAALFNYAARCVLDGELEALFKMGFTMEDLRNLSDIRITDLHAVSGARAHPLNVTLDRPSWEWLLAQSRLRRTRDSLKRELLLLDAPAEMMMSFFGISAKQYAHERVLAGVEVVRGRPPSRLEDPAAEERVWSLWILFADPVSPGKLRSEDLWLLIGREVPNVLRSAWTMIQQWSNDAHMLERFSAERAGLRGDQIASEEQALRTKHRVYRTEIATPPIVQGRREDTGSSKTSALDRAAPKRSAAHTQSTTRVDKPVGTSVSVERPRNWS